MQLKAAYYIDEVAEAIFEKTGICLGKALYRRSGFSLPDMEEQESSVEPLYAVLFNQISRGIPTRAGLRLTEFLLSHYVPKELLRSIDNIESHLFYKIHPDFWNNLTPEISRYWFQPAMGTDQYLDFYPFLQLVEIPWRAAQMHKSLAAMLVIGQIQPKEEPITIATCLPKEIGKVILEELNIWIEYLCILADKPELLVKFQLSSPNKADFFISFEREENPSASLARVLLPIQPCVSPKNKFQFADAIDYPDLGEEEEWEENGRTFSRFNFYNTAREEALRFFVQNFFRNTDFFPGQVKIINRALQKLDVIGLLPTGGGKSLTYQLCGLLQPGITVIVDPINSLMKDQFSKMIGNGINNSAFVNIMLTRGKRVKRLTQLANRELLFLFISPERFQILEYRQALIEARQNEGCFHYAVIDEAHCVSEWGHDFRPSYLNLAPSIRRFLAKKAPKIYPTIFGLTATASFDVLADIQRELNVSEDAICTLPGDSIDRKELNFEVIQVDYNCDENKPYYARDREIGFVKYPLLENILKTFPEKLAELARSKLANYRDAFLHIKKDGRYVNGGVVFCPTKSPSLSNGVLAVRDGYSSNRGIKNRIKELDVGIFMGGGDVQKMVNEDIVKEAEASERNQELFLDNKLNLMICTKAFGMGIDKDNIRLTVHYAMPSSVEGFYQEAGRAGRNRKPSLCVLLYNEHDRLVNLDFVNNTYKSGEREQRILEELMTEVRYDAKFFERILARKASEASNISVNVRLWNPNGMNRLYINGPFKEKKEDRVNFGFIDLNNRNSIYDLQNAKVEDAEFIHQAILDTIQWHVGNGNAVEWLTQETAPGIQEQLGSMDIGQDFRMVVGFENDGAKKFANALNEIIPLSKWSNVWEKIIYSAYDFSQNEEEFFENLNYHFRSFLKKGEPFLVDPQALHSEALRKIIKSSFPSIRNLVDTQKAIYRLTALGIIDDYIVDYNGRLFEIKFKAKPVEKYRENLKQYLKRYLGERQADRIASKAFEKASKTYLAPYYQAMVDFVHSEISDKRKRAVEYMKELCLEGIEEGQKRFRESIKYYFTSKYARLNYLPKDTEDGKISNPGIVFKYLRFISQPPDGLGTPLDNLKHLRGACARLLLTSSTENNSLKILDAVAVISLEASRAERIDKLIEAPLFQNAMEQFYDGFCHLEFESVNEVDTLLNRSIQLIADIAPRIERELQKLRGHIKGYFLLRKVKQFRKSITPIP